jgi:hypothetical protein
MVQITYGVFKLGQIWSVVAGDGTKIGFTSRENALAAAQEMATSRAGGEDAEITLQDELGLLTTLRLARG